MDPSSGVGAYSGSLKSTPSLGGDEIRSAGSFGSASGLLVHSSVISIAYLSQRLNRIQINGNWSPSEGSRLYALQSESHPETHIITHAHT